MQYIRMERAGGRKEKEEKRRRRSGYILTKTGTSWHDHQWSTLIFKCPDQIWSICASTKAWDIDASSALNKEILLVLAQI